MPPGIEQAYLFQVFNTLSWQIMQGLPVSLFFKFMGASNTILGLASSLNPLMMLLQIPAANYVEQVGYRRFALGGWGTRTLFVGLLAMVPLLLGILDRSTGMLLTFFLLLVYSCLRGISTCAFLPWITQLVPEKVRGPYIYRDQMCSAVATLLTLLLVAILFYPQPSPLSFTWVFCLSFFSGLISLIFLQRIPDVPVPHTQASSAPVPWVAMLRFEPFYKLMRYNLLMNSIYAATIVFWMPVLRDNFHWPDWQILALSAFSIVTSTWIIRFFGGMLDRVGSLPLLYLGTLVTFFHLLMWFLTISKILPMNPLSVFLIGLTGGIGMPLFNLANTRLVMSTVPEMGRCHFFALYTVLNSLVLGLVPIVWGLILDGTKKLHIHWASARFDHYSLLYFFLALGAVGGLPLLTAIHEQRALSNEAFFRKLLVETPSRAITQLLRGRS